MLFDNHRDPRSHEQDLIADATGCLVYAFHFGREGRVVFEWQAGGHGDVICPIRDLVDGHLEAANVERVERHLSRLRSGHDSQVRIRHRPGVRSRRHLHDRARVELDAAGKLLRVVGAVRDVVDDHEEDVRLRDGRRRVIESLDQGVALWDQGEKLVLANRTFSEMFAPQGGEAFAIADLDAFLVDLSTSGEVVIEGSAQSWMERTLRDRQRQARVEWSMADGRFLTAAWREVDGGTLLRVEDSTRARGGERALQRAKQLAEDASYKKSRFLRAANHDLRQPLATLKILIFSASAVSSDIERRELFRSMDVSINVMEGILDALIQIGQLDADRVTANTHHFQLSEMFGRLRAQFEPLAKQQTLDFRVVASPLTLESDRVLLERIVSNLLSNAIRFTRHGGLLLGARRRGRHAEIQVWDTGSGIPGDQLERIFEEFHQAEGQPSDRQRGLGLGLNIVRRLSELLQHPIRVSSVVGRGSVFTVAVPIGNVWQSRVGEAEISERVGGEFLDVDVLLIEDNANLRDAMHEMLLRWGVRVLSVQSGAAALAALRDTGFHPELVIVDYRLPSGEAGTDLLARIRESVGEEVPGIVCTADNDPTFVASIRRLGLPILIKPTSPPRLRSVMHHLLYERARSRPID